MRALFLRFVQDETAGIYFYSRDVITSPVLHAGDIVEIEGHSNRGEYAPIVDVSSIKRIGPGVFPAAKPVDIEQLSSGQEDSQFLEIHGLVHAVRYDEHTRYYSVDIATGSQMVLALLRNCPCPPPLI